MLLEVRSLVAHYGSFQALFGVDLAVDEGQTVAIVGANGAGKSTLLRSLAGLLVNKPEMVCLQGRPIGALPAAEVLEAGVAMVPEGRRLFRSLSVEENLMIGAHARSGDGRWNLETIYELFPVLRERRGSPGTALSGGQQQMVAIGRALMSNPRILLCDELSLGLAPVVIKDIYATLGRIKGESSTAVVIVEQDITQALQVSDCVHCMMEGRVTLSGAPAQLAMDDIQHAYFGSA